MLIPKSEIIRSPAHRKFVASLPCCISGNVEVQAAHLRAGFLAIGMKPSDDTCVPLYHELHAEQHRWNEESFWHKYGHTIEEVRALGKALYAVTGNHDRGEFEVLRFMGFR